MSDRASDAPLRVLVTNDDGIDAPALGLLAARLHAAGHDVQIAAPLVEHTGCGASLGPVREGQPVATRIVRLDACPDVPAVAVDAPPALAVLAASQGRFGRVPDVVVSGTNAGFNTGPAVLHSGTVGAVLTASAHGLAGIALSTERDATYGFTTAAEFCALAIVDLLHLAASGSALNINVPDRPLRELAGVRATTLTSDSIVSIAIEQDAGGLRLQRIRGESRAPVTKTIDDSDAAAIRAGHISITRVLGGIQHLPLNVNSLNLDQEAFR